MSPMIYGLVDPRTGKVRYVGKSLWHWAVVLGRHVGMAQKAHRYGGDLKSSWILELLDLDLVPEVRCLESVADVMTLNAAERRWINHFGLDTLLNKTHGGGGGAVPYYYRRGGHRYLKDEVAS